MYIPKKSNIIVVRGVLIEDLVYETPAPQIFDRKPEEVSGYRTIPRRFTTVDEWPHTSNLACWHCDQIPTGYPAFIPTNVAINYTTAAGAPTEICDVFGHFCTWNCAVAYVHDHFKDELKWDAIDSIRSFAALFSPDKKIDLIAAAPPKTLMTKYCGERGITSQQWYELLAQGCAAYSGGVFKFDAMKES